LLAENSALQRCNTSAVTRGQQPLPFRPRVSSNIRFQHVAQNDFAMMRLADLPQRMQYLEMQESSGIFRISVRENSRLPGSWGAGLPEWIAPVGQSLQAKQRRWVKLSAHALG
jgi:hypothetical protein